MNAYRQERIGQISAEMLTAQERGRSIQYVGLDGVEAFLQKPSDPPAYQAEMVAEERGKVEQLKKIIDFKGVTDEEQDTTTNQTASDGGGGGKKPLPQDDQDYPVKQDWGQKPAEGQSGDMGETTINADGTYSQKAIHWTGNGKERYYSINSSTGGMYLHYDANGNLVKQMNRTHDKPVVLPTSHVIKLQKQTQHVINQARVDANAHSGLAQGMMNLYGNHKGEGFMDFKVNSPDRLFIIDGKVYRADEFGNYIAGYSGDQWLPVAGPLIMKAAGIAYDFLPWIFGRDDQRDWGLDFDADSRPDINAGIKKSKEENKEK